jgi:hypothetical protein
MKVVARAERGWRTHERNTIRELLFHDKKKGTCNLVCLTHKGIHTWINPYLLCKKNNL